MKQLAIIAVFVSFLSGVLAAELSSCYQCSSSFNPNCTQSSDALTDRQHRNCTDGADVCYKIVTLAYNKNDEVVSESVVRGCGRSSQLTAEGEKEAADGCKTVSYLNRERTICVCREDGCNGATTLGLGALLPALTVATAITKMFV